LCDVIARVAKVFGINSTSNAIEIVQGEAEYYRISSIRPHVLIISGYLTARILFGSTV